MDTITSLFISSDEITPEMLKPIQEKIKIIEVKKGEILQSKGDQKKMSFFVKKGLLRTYTLDEKGKEHIFMFAPEGWIAGDIESLTKNAPATLYIEALEDSELEAIGEDTLSLLALLPISTMADQAERLLRRVAVLQHRVIMLMSASAAERYEDFISTYPNVTQRIPQKMIASYLGITPEALSKIRKELSTGK